MEDGVLRRGGAQPAVSASDADKLAHRIVYWIGFSTSTGAELRYLLLGGRISI